MKIFFVLSFISVVTAAVIPFDGLRQQNATTNAINETEKKLDTTILNDEGYKYKSVRRLKYRVRRDVSHLENDYLPPVEEDTKDQQIDKVSEYVNEYLPPAEEVTTEEGSGIQSKEESAVLGENGYVYRTVRRLKYRQRRDVSEIANEYLPPAEEATTEAVAELKSPEQPEDSAILGENGYEYKTVRRLKYRQRRDVSEIANEYLPPAEEVTTEGVAELKSDTEPEDSAVLGENGYEYKTVRCLKYRQRRDVSEIADEYLPPAEEVTTEGVAELKSVTEPGHEYLPPAEEVNSQSTELKSAEEPEDSAVLGVNGYEYKTVRRLKYRQRRDVSEIANEYLPPAEEATTEAVAEVKSAEEPEDSAVLGEYGYEYKTVRRLKYRQRRDVSEIANEYLPPAEEATTEAVAELKSVEEIANEYLPPAEEVTFQSTELKSAEEPEDSAVLGENGYEYKTVRRLKYRQRRDVSEIANEYLPPAEDVTTEAVAELKTAEELEDSAVLGENGYEYKTVRRLKYRHRRDVSEIANEYLPPAEEATTEAVAELKSVDKFGNEYLPPAEEVTSQSAELKSVTEPEDSAVLGENGYEYKTVRRLKYRQRRDASEIAKEYLPPVEEATTELISSEEPKDSAALGENGYEYKTIRRLKYRH